MEKKIPDQQHGFQTIAVHAGDQLDPITGSLTTPIYQSSTFVFPTAEAGGARFAGAENGYVYTRLGNPTLTVLEQKIAALEKAEAALAFSSGMAAVSAILLGLLHSGDHILCSKGLYGCTFGLLTMLKRQFQIDHSLADLTDESSLLSSIRPNTRIIYVETPINPTMELVDLAMIARAAKARRITTVVDNTFLSPYLQRPLELGCDLVLHSATKYIGGHGDVIAGVAAGAKDLIDQLRMTALKDIGGVLSPFDAYLLIRGLKTLGIRMQKHCENAQLVAEFLANHPRVQSVYYPGLPSFPQHELAKRQMDGFGGLISFELKGGMAAGIQMMNRLQLCKLAVSLGDVETLIQHPASMTHSIVPMEERRKMGITDGLIRLSVGIEDVKDIIADLSQALE
ncbi:methionine gamma-lyase [Brevibacillus migulae]|uniref:methionine gamma-lyase n=1 Tax=Brevibacillus migulae TaxID=1644114 RepID=UPI00106EEA96|nr:methionine gamma-lyase [Brevibacillus migulae]